MSGTRLGDFLKTVADWNWEEFCKAEHDPSYSSNDAMIFGLIRSCAMQKMDAIKLSLNRLDGKLKTPIKIEYPKIFYLFPNAKPITPTGDIEQKVTLHRGDIEQKSGVIEGELLPPPDITINDPEDKPTMSLRETLSEMATYPRELPANIIEFAQLTEWALRDNDDMPDEVPSVKAVVAAHLLVMAQKRDLTAISEVFDQLDGKLAETIQLLGEDIYITLYSSDAPPDATLNADGVMQVEAVASQNMWAEKLGAGRG